jgi:hypothetical protein
MAELGQVGRRDVGCSAEVERGRGEAGICILVKMRERKRGTLYGDEDEKMSPFHSKIPGVQSAKPSDKCYMYFRLKQRGDDDDDEELVLPLLCFGWCHFLEIHLHRTRRSADA